jgi:hypothetical protein
MDFLLKVRNYLKERLDRSQIEKLKRTQRLKFRGLQDLAYKIFFASNLKYLSVVYNTDKWGTHWYAQHYEKLFSPFRERKIKVLEIGIGGYDDPEDGGGSLRMWRTYFPKAQIYGIDIYDKTPHNEPRIKTFKGSQIDKDFLNQVLNEIGDIDIIIDDGSHENTHVLQTFHFLFPRLSANGIYVIEDTQTSYWSSFGGSSNFTSFDGLDTTMRFLKKLVDGLNYAEFEIEDYVPSYCDMHIVAIHFFHNIVFIEKGINNERRDSNRN